MQDFCSTATLLALKRLTGRVCGACCERRTALIAPGLPTSRQVKQQHTVVNRGMMELLYAQRRRREPWNDGRGMMELLYVLGRIEFDRGDSKTQTQTQASGASWCCWQRGCNTSNPASIAPRLRMYCYSWINLSQLLAAWAQRLPTSNRSSVLITKSVFKSAAVAYASVHAAANDRAMTNMTSKYQFVSKLFLCSKTQVPGIP